MNYLDALYVGTGLSDFPSSEVTASLLSVGTYLGVITQEKSFASLSRQEKYDLYLQLADPGCLSRIRMFPFRIRMFSIPDSGQKDFRSRIRKRIKELFLSSRKCDPGCSSPDPDLGVKKGTGFSEPGSGSASMFVSLQDESPEKRPKRKARTTEYYKQRFR
jgi:hypothetical protein